MVISAGSTRRFARRTILTAFLVLTSAAPAFAGEVTIAWNAVPEPGITGYRLSYGRAPGAYTNRVDLGTVTSYTLDLPADGSAYHFAVQARREQLLSDYSSEVRHVTRLASASSPQLVSQLWKSNFEGVNYASFTVWEPETGAWNVLRRSPQDGSTTSLSRRWGIGAHGDVPVSGDYDGDGRTDFAVWRPTDGVWYILQSSSGYSTSITVQWGTRGDVPVPGDYDGDGRTDLAVWRPSDGRWYIRTSSTGYTGTQTWQWGAGSQGDIPVPGDYDGDGSTDIAIWRPASGTWWLRTSSSLYANSYTVQWGAREYGDVPVTGDFDGDGRTDLAVWRRATGVWWVKMSSTGFSRHFSVHWGSSAHGDVPVPNDSDGDGISDIAVWRPQTRTWFVLTSSSGFRSWFSLVWGSASSIPIR